MKILVTGAAGFIGSNFVFHMLEAHPDYEIVGLDALTYAGNLETLAPVIDDPNFKFVKADITDAEAIDKLFAEEKFDIVVNFAAESHVDRSIEDPGLFWVLMKSTAICRSTDLTSSSSRRCRLQLRARTQLRRLRQTCLRWHITALTDCL